MSERETARDLIQRSYWAFNSRDLDAALSATHPEVDWPNALNGGRLRGHAGIRRYWEQQFEVMDPRVEPRGMRDEADGRVVVDVRQVVRDLHGTLIADQRVEHIYALRDGLIARMDIREP